MNQTTAGWELQVEWKDGSTSWLPLKELKETKIVDVAQYAVDNQIDHEPAFEWWVRGLVVISGPEFRFSGTGTGISGFFAGTCSDREKNSVRPSVFSG
jgi:hypothetical protein